MKPTRVRRCIACKLSNSKSHQVQARSDRPPNRIEQAIRRSDKPDGFEFQRLSIMQTRPTVLSLPLTDQKTVRNRATKVPIEHACNPPSRTITTHQPFFPECFLSQVLSLLFNLANFFCAAAAAFILDSYSLLCLSCNSIIWSGP